MPRIIIGNPLGTAGEGMAQGADLVRREREHQARMKAFEADLEQASLRTDMAKRAEQMQIEDRRRQQSEAEGLRGILGSMEGIPDDQKEWLSRLEDPKSIPVAFQLIAKDREERTRAQHQQSLDAELMASANDPEFPIDPGLAQATVAAYGDDYQGARGALRKLRTQQRHMQVQTQQRSFARGEMLNLMSTFPEAFRPPPPGMAATAEQDLIADLMDELDDDPLDIEKGSADYLGALAELRVLADPSLKGAHRRVSERYRQDFEAATRATAEVQGAGPRPPVGTVEQGIEGAQLPGDVQGVLDQEKRDHVQGALDAANGEDPDMVIGGSNTDVQARVAGKLNPNDVADETVDPRSVGASSWTGVSGIGRVASEKSPEPAEEPTGFKNKNTKGPQGKKPKATGKLDRGSVIEVAIERLIKDGFDKARVGESIMQEFGINLTDEELRDARREAVRRSKQ